MYKSFRDYSKLLGLLKERGVNQAELAEVIGISPTTLSLKINGKADFKLSEIKRICSFLEISAEKIGGYFFN